MGEVAVEPELESRVAFTRELEDRYRAVSGLADRSQYRTAFRPQLGTRLGWRLRGVEAAARATRSDPGGPKPKKRLAERIN